ncbi:MAG TPA: hypothetical protein V6C65_02660, partial [Allocoleopsis sp.]
LIGANATNPGNASSGFEADILRGGTEADQFVLGNGAGIFYVGFGRYAEILDFRRSEGDKIVLKGNASQYRMDSAGSGAGKITSIRYDGDLIGVVSNKYQVSPLSFAQDFIFVP